MTNLVQQTPEWLEFRKHHVGSSDIAAIVGMNPWKSAHELWMELTGKKEPIQPNEAMLRGLALEPEARIAFETKHDISMMPRVITSKEHEFCSASLDGISFDGKSILEIKCPQSNKTLTLAILGDIEPHYMCQIQWQLMISSANLCYFWVYHPVLGSAVVKVKPDKDMQAYLLNEAIAFWDLVITNSEPENPANFTYIDTPEFLAISKEYKEIEATWQALGKKKDALKKEMLDETDGGNVKGGGVTISWVYPDATIDWDAVRAEFRLTDDKLAKFKLDRKPYCRVSIDKK